MVIICGSLEILLKLLRDQDRDRRQINSHRLGAPSCHALHDVAIKYLSSTIDKRAEAEPGIDSQSSVRIWAVFFREGER
jgi:hypothetical protein